MRRDTAALPLAVVTGFLGSGKTTLLNRLLRDPALADTAVVVNEFGEIALDHALMRPVADDTVVLGSGCVCCGVRDGLLDTLRRLYLQRAEGALPRFRRVVLETSGLAEPAPVLATVVAHPLLGSLYAHAGVTTTVDAQHGARTLEEHPEALHQVVAADRLLLTKTDLASTEAVRALETDLRRLNPDVPLQRVAEAGPDTLFGGRRPRPEAGEAAHDHAHSHGIESLSLRVEAALDRRQTTAWLQRLATAQEPELLRVKGLLRIAGLDGLLSVHGVRHVFHPPEVVADDGDGTSRLVLIGRGLPAARLRAEFAALAAETPPASALASRPPGLD